MNCKRNVYLKLKSLEEAKDILFSWFSNFAVNKKEMVLPFEAVGRVLADPIIAKLSSPNFNAAAMDGVAVNASDTFSVSEINPKELCIEKNAYYINTGHVMPENTDAVIMIEYVQILDNNRIKIETSVVPWQNVRKIGEDIVFSELLYTSNYEITPYCVGVFIAAGVHKVSVRKKPKVLIIPTGSELVDFMSVNSNHLKPGQIFETNSYVLEKMVEMCGGCCIRHETILDSPELIENAVSMAYNSDIDIVLTLGGSSAGSEDYVLQVATKLGKVLIHGVSIMPGKPTIIADVFGKPFFGIPGYPVSAIIAFEQFVRPMIRKMLYLPDICSQNVDVKLLRKIPSKLGVEEFLRVKLGEVGNKIVAIPLPRGAGSITSMTEADGIIRVDMFSEGINDNEIVKAELLRPISMINSAIVAVGSHDNSLSLLANHLKCIDSNFSLSSSHVGSMGGLVAIKRDMCHVAGVHLLDIENGRYNISYLNKYLPDIEIKLVNLVMRDQGLIVLKGNPKKIMSINDLIRDDVVFVNRQVGSGTRILLDYKIKENGLSSDKINGYAREEYTHMAIAVTVLNGSADVGLGIYSSAMALGLDFVPIVTEQYDLVVLSKYFKSKKIQVLMEIINSSLFKKDVMCLGGYDVVNTGKIIL